MVYDFLKVVAQFNFFLEVFIFNLQLVLKLFNFLQCIGQLNLPFLAACNVSQDSTIQVSTCIGYQISCNFYRKPGVVLAGRYPFKFEAFLLDDFIKVTGPPILGNARV